jgi:hypothetical protein
MSKKLKFWLSTLAFVFVGGGIGFLIGFLSEGKASDGWFSLKWYVVFPYDVVFFLLAFACLVLLVLVLRGLQTLKKQPREAVDDELYSPAEQAVSRLFMQATLLQWLATLWLFAVASYAFELSGNHERIVGILLISSIVLTGVGWFLVRKVTKQMNELVPRLAVDLYDTNPQKQYNDLVQRLDESEKLQMYKAGFLAMRRMLTLLYVLLFVILMYSMLVESQLNLLLLVGALAIANQTFYFIAANQQTKTRRISS